MFGLKEKMKDILWEKLWKHRWLLQNLDLAPAHIGPYKSPIITFKSEPEEEVMAKKKTSSKSVALNKEPVFTWAMESSRPRAGGAKILYEVRLNEDGKLTCNCPGWVFKKKTEVRGCKHTKLAEVESSDIFKKWKKGELLPTMEVGATTTLSFSMAVTEKAGGSKFGRKLIID